MGDNEHVDHKTLEKKMNYLFKYLNISFFCCVFLVACSGKDNLVNPNTLDNDDNISKSIQTEKKGIVLLDDNGKLGEIFKGDGNKIGSVNKYLWQATLEVLYLLPIETADPFTGIIAFGKGKVPGGKQSYDATVYISDPALDARSLSVTLRSSNEIISAAANREVENAILSRARQLRLKELDF